MNNSRKPGYRDQGKKRKDGVKHGFAINQEQMEFERRKLLEEMSTKVTKKSLNNMAAVAATKEPEYLDEEGNKREPTMRISYRSAQGFSLPVSHSWHKKD